MKMLLLLLLLLLLLVDDAALSSGCQAHHVCLRGHRIDTRNRPNISHSQGAEEAVQLHEPIFLFHTGSTYKKKKMVGKQQQSGDRACGMAGYATRYHKLGKQVIVKLSTWMLKNGNAYEMLRESLDSLGCAILHYLPHHSLGVFIPELGVLENVKSISGVAWVGDYKSRYKVAPEWRSLKRNMDVMMDSSGRILVTVLIPGSGMVALTGTCELVDLVNVLMIRWWQSLKKFLSAHNINQTGGVGVEFTNLGPDSILAAVPLNDLEAVIRWLSWQEWVSWIAPAFRGRLGNMFSSAIQQSGASVPLQRGAPFAPARPLWSMGIMGDGQILGIGDSGVDILSCYFRDEQVPLPGPSHRKVLSYRVMSGGDTVDNYGHGSHVAGSILGQCEEIVRDYSVTSEKYNGMAPHAKLVFTDIGVGKNTYVTPPMDLGDYYWEAYSLGARIHSDSWTTGDSSYNIMSRSVDLFTFNNPLFLPIFAAGNAGSSHSSAGTISSPAMSKNSLTVGATLGAVGHAVRPRGRNVHGTFTMIHPNPEQTCNGTRQLALQKLDYRILEHSYGATFSDHWGPIQLIRASPEDACSSLQNADSIRGKLVLANREGCSCIDKFIAVQVGGGAAVLLFNNENTGYFFMGPASEHVTIPGGSVPNAFGELLDVKLSQGHQIFVELLGHSVDGEDRFDTMTSFSSWGPTTDGRLKPEIVAPGDRITSAKSNTESQGPTCETLVLSGTSMAAPIAAGGAALVRQYFVEGFYPTGSKVFAHSHEPSGALLKAIIINGAMPLQGLNGVGVSIDPPPSYNQGYGRIDLLNTLVLPAHNSFQVAAKEGIPLKTGYGQRHCFLCISGSGDLKFTLVWHDPPASPAASVILVNDLDLSVIDPNGRMLHGNGGLVRDSLNNVEQVSIPTPIAGRYVVDVYAHHIPELGADGLGQAFAFVARGPLTEVPCLEVKPASVPPAIGNNTSIRVILEGTSGTSIQWFCRLNASIETDKSHDWQVCGSFPESAGAYLLFRSEYFVEDLPDACYTFAVQARDNRYINTAYSATSFVTFTIDTKAPRTILISSSASVFRTTSVFDFSSDATDTDHFECKLTGTRFSAPEGGDNLFTSDWERCTPPASCSAPSDGNYTFHVRAVDVAGNADPQPSSVNWLLHTRPPRAKIISMLPKGLSNSSTRRFHFELDYPNLPGKGKPSWSCRLDLGKNTRNETTVFGWKPCCSPLLVTETEDGRYMFSVRAVAKEGLGGLSSIPATHSFVCDRTPPQVFIFAAPPPISSSPNVTFVFQSSEASVERCCLVRLANTTEREMASNCCGNCMSPASYWNLQDGVYFFSVQATDLAGNTGAITKYDLVVDTVPPSVLALSLSQADPEFVVAEFVVEDGSLESASGVSTCFCCLKSHGQFAAWLPCSSPWKVNKSRLFFGVTYKFMVKAEDRAYNLAPDHVEQELVLVAPNLTTSRGLAMTGPCPDAYTQHRNATLFFSSANTSTTSLMECQEDEQAIISGCTSPYHVGPLLDGQRIFKVRLASSTGSSWVGCSWFIDTLHPTTSIRTPPHNLDTISPSFEIIGRDDGSGIHKYECMLQALDPEGSNRHSHTWRSCPQQVTYDSLATSLYLFQARSIDVAGNVDPIPPRDVRIRGDANYHVCQTPGLCTFPLLQNGTIASSFDGGSIAMFPSGSKDHVAQEYGLDANPYTPVASARSMKMDIGFRATLCSPLSNVSFLTSGSQPQPLLLMLRYRFHASFLVVSSKFRAACCNVAAVLHNRDHVEEEFPFILSGDLDVTSGKLYVIYTNEAAISLTTLWETVNATPPLDGDGYITTTVARLGSYMVIKATGAASAIIVSPTSGASKRPSFKVILSGMSLGLVTVSMLVVLVRKLYNKNKVVV